MAQWHQQEEEKRFGPRESSRDTEDNVDNPKAVIGTPKTSIGTKLTAVEQVGNFLINGKKFIFDLGARTT